MENETPILDELIRRLKALKPADPLTDVNVILKQYEIYALIREIEGSPISQGLEDEIIKTV